MDMDLEPHTKKAIHPSAKKSKHADSSPKKKKHLINALSSQNRKSPPEEEEAVFKVLRSKVAMDAAANNSLYFSEN